MAASDIPTGQTSGMSSPITYMFDGKQYFASMGGNGGPAGGHGCGAAEQQKQFVFTLNPGK